MKRKLRRQSGQALLEYILLVFISVILIGGIIYQFNDAFRQYSQILFVGEDSYLGCLIKYGLLPGASSDYCTPPQFNLAAGKPMIEAGQGNGENSASSNAAKKAAAKSGSGDGSSSGRASESSSHTIGFNSADRRNAGLHSANGSEQDKKKSSTGNNGVSGGLAGTSADESGGGGSEVPYSSGRRRTAGDELGDAKKNGDVPLTSRDMKTAREIAAETAKQKAAALEAENEQFTFGNLFKYLIILLLLFAIIFFIGSQVVAVSRSKKRK